jgi:hypothetical protein
MLASFARPAVGRPLLCERNGVRGSRAAQWQALTARDYRSHRAADVSHAESVPGWLCGDDVRAGRTNASTSHRCGGDARSHRKLLAAASLSGIPVAGLSLHSLDVAMGV